MPSSISQFALRDKDCAELLHAVLHRPNSFPLLSADPVVFHPVPGFAFEGPIELIYDSLDFSHDRLSLKPLSFPAGERVQFSP